MKPRQSEGLNTQRNPRRTRSLSGKAGAGVIAAALVLLAAAAGFGYYLLHGPTIVSVNSGAQSAASGRAQRLAVEPAPPEDQVRTDSSNRERIIPGSNIAPPTVDYAHNPADAASRAQGSGGYGSDSRGGGSAPPN